MNKRIQTGAFVMASTVILSVSALLFINDDRAGFWAATFKSTPALPAVMNARYENECGACHFAYQPGWLPARSWKKMMGELNDHFDENAELGRKANNEITDYLIAESADVRPNRKSHKILASISNDASPLRISTLRYIIGKHAEIPQQLIGDNDKVRSLSNCLACHSDASKGQFNEHAVNIPGYGSWDD